MAAVDVTGAAEEGVDGVLRRVEPRKDSTVVAIANVTPMGDERGALTRIVEIYWWTGRPLHEQYDELVYRLKEQWRCRRVTVDASGLGADLAGRRGARVRVTDQGGRSPEAEEFWREAERVRPVVRIRS